MTPEPLPPGAELPCAELVEKVTDYLEDALSPADRAQVDAHLGICEGCTTVVDQWRQVIRLSGRLAEDDVDAVAPATLDRLMDAFRHRHPG